MAATIFVAFVAIFGYFLYSNISGLYQNIAAAKRSGLPYIIVPWDIYNSVWLPAYRSLRPLLEILPKSWTEDWLPYLIPGWVWEQLFHPFEKYGDAFLTVSPGSVHIWLANAEAIHQVASRREAFPKPLEFYRILEIFGRNVVTTEGSEWKQHRRITSPAFNEKNNVLVFAEACNQAQGMLRKWTEAEGSGKLTLEEVPRDTMRLTLHIISKIGFGVRLLWPGEAQNEQASARDTVYSSNNPPPGYTMGFEFALETLLENLPLVLVTPKWLLKRLPTSGARRAYESYVNWEQYTNALFSQKVKEAGEDKQTEGMDIMGSLVRSSYGVAESKQKTSPGRLETGEAGKPTLSDTDIFGNAFIMLFAGHETTANAVHFSLMELAINPRAQRLLQKEVHGIFGVEPPETWDYESNINTLLGGMVGAVLNEQLRLMPSVTLIPKQVSKLSDQDIILDGKKHTLPAGAHIGLAAVCAHRNPKYWPAQPSKITDQKNDIDDFRPERWLLKPGAERPQPIDITTNIEEDDFGGYTGQDTSAQLFRPVRGSYLPFSEGARSCLGRRLAQVEVMAVLAVIFQKYSIELAVDEWATDDEVSKMTDNEKRAVYKKAQDKARKTIRGATTVLSLKLHSGFVPVRVVKKGEERFVNIIE